MIRERSAVDLRKSRREEISVFWLLHSTCDPAANFTRDAVEHDAIGVGSRRSVWFSSFSMCDKRSKFVGVR